VRSQLDNDRCGGVIGVVRGGQPVGEKTRSGMWLRWMFQCLDDVSPAPECLVLAGNSPRPITARGRFAHVPITRNGIHPPSLLFVLHHLRIDRILVRTCYLVGLDVAHAMPLLSPHHDTSSPPWSRRSASPITAQAQWFPHESSTNLRHEFGTHWHVWRLEN
jgi:hypothetical protein